MMKDEKQAVNNWVAKHAGFNRAATHVDRKKKTQNPRKAKYKSIDY